MPCLLVLLALLLPRVAMVLIWIFSDAFARVFDTWVWPLLGFIFVPYTTLVYMWAFLATGGTITIGWIILIVIALLVDIAHWGGSVPRRRRTV